MHIDRFLQSLGLPAFDVDITPEAIGKLLAAILYNQRLLTASADIGQDWDTNEVWVKPGENVHTRIVPVEKGEIICAKIINRDVYNANAVYLAQIQRASVTTYRGLDHTVQVPTGGWLLDFNEGGPNLAAAIPAGEYSADELSAVIASAMTTAGTQTYSVDYLPSKKYRISAGANFSLLVSSGPNVAPPNDIFYTIGFTGADRTGAATYDGDSQRYNEAAVDWDWEDKMFPLPAGQETTMVLTSHLYAALEDDVNVQVPLMIKRTRLWSARR